MSLSCINIVGTVISPDPQSGINNVFGVNVSLDPWPVSENVTVSGYLRDDNNFTNIYQFNLTITSFSQSAETANNVLVCDPTATATIFITGVTPTIVTFTGTSYPICGFGPPPTPTITETPSQTPTTTETPIQTLTESPTNTPTETPTQTITDTPTPTETPTQTPTETLTPTVTETPTNTPSVTLTQTQTQTPSIPPTSVWYQLTNCADSSIEFSDEYPFGTFTINDRVTSPGNIWVVTGNVFTNPGGTLYAISSTGQIGCPSIITPTPTITETSTPTPSLTIGITPTTTETSTPTPTETLTQTPSETPTQTPSQTETATQTPTETQTQTPTPDPTSTSTPSITPTNTVTQTQTPTPSPTLGFAVQFVDCSDNTNVFRFNDPAIPSTLGVTYYITGSTSFSGCATTVVNNGTGPQFNGTGVSFLMTAGGCGDPICPRASNRAALLTRCTDGEVLYFNVEEDTAFVGAAYVYDDVCYSFVEFSGPGGDSIGSPQFDNCIDCLLQPTPSATPYVTPTNTPTVSSTPPACSFTTFCLSSPFSSLVNYNGNYTNVGFYNGKPYYEGDGITTAYIYYVTGTSEYWCLSNSLGGLCILQGASPCYSQCPDILANGFTGGICPTPTPTPINCNTFNFNAFFDCDWEPLPTPTPSVACDDVDFDMGFIGVTPTPTPTGIICNGTSIVFSMSGFTPAVTPTLTLTPSVTLTRTVDVQGQATFNMLDETFNCVSVKVLKNCDTGAELYTSSNLNFSGITVITGMTFFALINEVNVCVTYMRDDSNFSSNSIVNQIFQIYSNCTNCSNVPTPTPSTTTTPTPTPSATAGLTPTTTATPPVTPTQTKTQTPTPSPTSTLGSTPTQTPSNTPTETPPMTPTQTQTASNTPTPSVTKTPTPTPIPVYVYESCEQLSFGKITSFAQVIQTQEISFTVLVGQSFKDDQGNCWYYIGRFSSDYIAPSTVTPITFQGDYFANASGTIFDSCEDCLTIVDTPQQTVTSVGGYMQPCIGGTINDFMGAFVVLDSPVTVETIIDVDVYFQYGNSYLQCTTPLTNNIGTTFSLTIPVGETSAQVDACNQGQYFSTGANICGACVSNSNNPNINFGSFGC